MRFFKNIADLQTLKSEFRRLSKIHHPDVGGKTEDMQDLLREYEMMKKSLENCHKQAHQQYYDYATWQAEQRKKARQEEAKRKAEFKKRKAAEESAKQKAYREWQEAVQKKREQEREKMKYSYGKQTTLF